MPLRMEIWQPRQPVLWLYLAFLLPSLVMLVVTLSMLADSAAGLLAALVLVGLQLLLLWGIVRALPRFRRQSPSLMVAAALWGGVVAIALASELNSASMGYLRAYGFDSLAAALTAPLNEDLLRFLGVLVILVLAYGRRITVMDGVVFGFLVGAGFEVVENLYYALGSDDLGETLRIGFMRLLVGFALHALWTAATGAVLASCLSRAQRGLGGRWLLLVPALVVPMLLHAGWDSPSFSALAALKLVTMVLLYALTLAAFFSAVAWGRRSEFAWFVETTGAPIDLPRFRRLPSHERRGIAAQAVRAEFEPGRADLRASRVSGFAE